MALLYHLCDYVSLELLEKEGLNFYNCAELTLNPFTKDELAWAAAWLYRSIGSSKAIGVAFYSCSAQNRTLFVLEHNWQKRFFLMPRSFLDYIDFVFMIIEFSALDRVTISVT